MHDPAAGAPMPEPTLADYTVHIAGAALQVGDQWRQRCGWCGAVLVDVDLRTVPEGAQAGQWPAGTLVAVQAAGDGTGVLYSLPRPTDGAVPTECCAALAYDVTGHRVTRN